MYKQMALPKAVGKELIDNHIHTCWRTCTHRHRHTHSHKRGWGNGQNLLLCRTQSLDWERDGEALGSVPAPHSGEGRRIKEKICRWKAMIEWNGWSFCSLLDLVWDFTFTFHFHAL